MATVTSHRSSKTWQRGKIACHKCAAPIYLYKIGGLPNEFSIQCQKCGDRSMYTNRELTIESMPERRKKPRSETRRR